MQPGESGKIPVKLNVGKHSGPANKTITVYTNAPGEGATVKLTIKGEVWAPVDVQPSGINFSRMNSDAAKDPSVVQKATIVNNIGQDADITDVRSTNPLFHAETKVLEPGKKWELIVTLASTPQLGGNNGSIEMSTGVKEMPTLSVPVSVFIVADVEVTPPNLMLRPDQPATNRSLFIRNNSKVPIKISDLKSSNPNLKISLDETQPGMMFKLNVDIPSNYEPAAGGDRITFKTDNATAKELTIPIVMNKPPEQPGKPVVMPGTPGAAAPGAALPTKMSIPPAQAEPAPVKPGQVQIAPKAAAPSAAQTPAQAPVRAPAEPAQPQVQLAPKSAQPATTQPAGK